MSDQPGAHLEEEPQDERGPQGSRDTGSDEPAAGPADRPEGRATDQSGTSAKPSEAEHPDAPDLQPGGGN
ncbi:MAG: hypothetical protein QOK15_1378 [Nocardioidaceae bacterium]|jgi:hypothetical protein|nr:hypothetical protein [Nocardioidaceae bacterium]